MKDSLIDSTAARQRLGDKSLMTMWRWVQAGILPAPVKINGRNFWREADIERIQREGAAPQQKAVA